eukprot:CAMPEP_0197322490 /NCGR_PEP_ID=MMETSP0891-20130614/69934_1 /TAXON_ID=44058 ORGANISM="Aureoumbra lagunensis, Strain CCMP1510" /NCGR_SAMPLE_ID=MMETSP0891 /ASSEMBLY_ACC=CAM_ASM_000534 /LENGTH=198 /DNA_ID=CAMNT_0042814913 /DNA_START=26 /DNA_END=622 /DNA_ORIENTATION=+
MASKLDYSKWDNITDEDDEEVDQNFRREIVKPGTEEKIIGMTSKGSEKGRYEFRHDGRLIYEWDQSLDEVNIYVKPPPGIAADMIECEIKPRRIRLGLRGNPPFLDEETFGFIVQNESSWTFVDGEITIILTKMRKAETWESALKGRGQVDPMTKEEIKKKIMLERFQEENPGFDFSGADFNGAVPDPRNFMDGVKYS